MESVSVPLRTGGKKMRKRRELDALVEHSLAKRACNSTKRQVAGNGINSQDQLLSHSTDDQEDYFWSKVRMTSRPRTKRFSYLRTCGPVIFIVTIFLLFTLMYWLYFDLREQLLDQRMRIEQVSAISQNVPESLQKWHENSKSLEQNQTALSSRMYEAQQRLETLERDFNQFKDVMHKKDESQENEKETNLQNTVASIGGKIQGLQIDVDIVKRHYLELKDVQQSNKDILTKLQSNQNTASSTNPVGNKTLEMIQSLNEQFTNRLQNVSLEFGKSNDTLSQKTKGLEEELRSNKIKLDSLNDFFANISSHVASIEDERPQFKQYVQSTFSRINAELAILKNNSARNSRLIAELQSSLVQPKPQQSNIIDKLFNESIKNNGASADQQTQDSAPANLSPMFSNSPSAQTNPQAANGNVSVAKEPEVLAKRIAENSKNEANPAQSSPVGVSANSTSNPDARISTTSTTSQHEIGSKPKLLLSPKSAQN